MSLRWTKEKLADKRANPELSILGAFREGRLIGLVQSSLLAYDENAHLLAFRGAHIDHLIVAESERGRGVGRSLLAASMDWARNMGASEIHLKVYEFNRDAIRFYESCQFETLNRTYRLKL